MLLEPPFEGKKGYEASFGASLMKGPVEEKVEPSVSKVTSRLSLLPSVLLLTMA